MNKKSVFFFLVSIILLVSSLWAYTYFPYYRVNASDSSIVDEFSLCKNVTNNNGVDMFIPTNSLGEWQSFIANSTGTNLIDCPLFAQWVQTSQNSSGTGSDYGRSVVVDSSGNVYVAGYTNSSLDFGNGKTISNDGGYDFFVVKYNSSGVAQWVQTSQSSSGTGDDYGVSVAVDSLGYVYVTGQTNSSLNYGVGHAHTNDGGVDFFVVKYSSGGVVQWARSSETSSGTGGDYGESVAVDSSGNVYVAGSTNGSLDFGNGKTISNDGSYDFFVVKYNNIGVPQWVQTSVSSSGTGSDYAYSVAVDSSGNVYVAGFTSSSLDFGNGKTISNDGNYDFFVVKYNGSGVPQWVQTSVSSSGTLIDYAYSVAVDSSGNVYVAGYTTSSLDFGNSQTISNEGNRDFFVVKYSSSGVAEWARSSVNSSGTLSDYGESVAVDSSGNVYVAGYTRSSLDFGNSQMISNDGIYDFFVVKYSSGGVAQWVQTSQSSSGAGSDLAYSVAVDSSGNVYVTGVTGSILDFGNGQTMTHNGIFVVKYG